MDEEKRNCGITFKAIADAIKALEAKYPPDKLCYIFPSPNKGKCLTVEGNIRPDTAAQMALDVWEGEKTVADFPEMEETDV